MDNLTQKQRQYCMSKIRSKDTKPEKVVRTILDKLNVRYNIHAKALPGTPDIVIQKIKKIMFINGCFWHQHKNCKRANIPKTNKEYWIKKLSRNAKKQNTDIKNLRKLGWSISVIWECQTKDETALIKKIKRICNNDKKHCF
jgi:DNA mismatch endonuclease (patch repair protein)